MAKNKGFPSKILHPIPRQKCLVLNSSFSKLEVKMMTMMMTTNFSEIENREEIRVGKKWFLARIFTTAAFAGYAKTISLKSVL